jgi:hypothetical protein
MFTSSLLDWFNDQVIIYTVMRSSQVRITDVNAFKRSMPLLPLRSPGVLVALEGVSHTDGGGDAQKEPATQNE